MKFLEYDMSAGAYSARQSLKPINFYCYAPRAKSVELTGDFNHWTPVAMQRRADGWWYLQAELTHGHHQYRFLIDGTPTLDPRSTGVGRNEANEAVSITAVS
jgi:1,4-alpha-glucan branching enzyme